MTRPGFGGGVSAISPFGTNRTRFAGPRPSAGHSVVVHAGGTPASAEHRRDAHRTISSCNRSHSSTRRRSSRSRSSRNWSTRHRDVFRCRGSRARRSRRTRCSTRRSRAAGSARTAAWAALSVAARRARTDHRPDIRELVAGSRAHPVAQRPAVSPDSRPVRPRVWSRPADAPACRVRQNQPARPTRARERDQSSRLPNARRRTPGAAPRACRRPGGPEPAGRPATPVGRSRAGSA